MPTPVAATAMTEVLHQPGGAGPVVVTFSEHGMRADGQAIWAGGVLRALDIAAVGVVARAPHWFPDSDVADYAGTIRAITGAHGRPWIGYGCSMGGYAAIRHAGALQLDVVLAMAPVWSIDPAEVTAVPARWAADHDPALHAGMAIGPGHAGAAVVYAFTDPCDPHEAFHVARIRAAIPGLRVVPVRHVGHHVARALAGTAHLAEILRIVQADPADAVRQLAALCAQARRGCEWYWYGLAEALFARNHLRWHAAAVTHAIARWPRSFALLLHAGRVACLRGDYLAMAQAMARAQALEPDNPHGYAWRGDFARTLGFTDEARACFRTAWRLGPELTHLPGWIAALS